jgi:hypothetical protein
MMLQTDFRKGPNSRSCDTALPALIVVLYV